MHQGGTAMAKHQVGYKINSHKARTHRYNWREICYVPEDYQPPKLVKGYIYANSQLTNLLPLGLLLLTKLPESYPSAGLKEST